MRKILLAGVTAAMLALVVGFAGGARAAEETGFKTRNWSFTGIFGTFDRPTLRRGFEVFKGVCSSCHSLKYVAYRNLGDIGFSTDEIKALAAEAQYQAGPNDQGEMYERPGRPSDRFLSPFANEALARLVNNGALPPDLSLIIKARDGGPNYVYALLNGYTPAPDGFELLDIAFYNKVFPGHQIAMAPPLVADAVDYTDGTPATVKQMANDVTTFLAWASEPEMEARKRLGVKVIIFLVFFTALLYAVKRKVWSKLH